MIQQPLIFCSFLNKKYNVDMYVHFLVPNNLHNYKPKFSQLL